MTVSAPVVKADAGIRIEVADDDHTVRESLGVLFAAEPGFQVVGAASDAGEAIRIADRSHPDVAVLDVRMPGGGGEAAASGIRKCSPKTRIVALSAYEDMAIVAQMVRAGVDAYLVKGAHSEEIVSTVRRVVTGQGTVSPEVAAGVLHELGVHLEREQRSDDADRRVRRRITTILEREALSMVFQPIADLRSGRVVGLESLARFRADLAAGPDDAFSAAWHVGRGPQLELLGARAALGEIDRIPPHAYIGVNLSPATLLSPLARETLAAMPAHRVVVEVTEHAPVEDYASLVRVLDRLRDNGIRLAVDDAGAGFASLRHILQLQPDLIKLDVSITRSIDADRSRRAMAAALISFAREMGASIVAEGIETSAELDALRSLGVPYGQGYFLEPPGPAPMLSLVASGAVRSAAPSRRRR